MGLTNYLHRAFLLALLSISLPLTLLASWKNPPRKNLPGLEHRTFRSASMSVDVGYNICLPTTYKSEAGSKFPVVYYLHGYDGHESSYLEYVRHWRNAQKTAGPSILVLVNGGGSSFFSDAADRSAMGETVVRELVQHIDSQFRTDPKPQGRSLHGYSMGGFGALKLAMKYPDLFGSAVAYGAVLSSAQDMQKHAGKVYRKVFGTPQRFEANDPNALVRQNAERLRQNTSFQLIIGTKDEFLAANQRLRDLLAELKISHDYVELPGVKHDKDPIYEKSAGRAFEFSAKAFRGK